MTVSPRRAVEGSVEDMAIGVDVGGTKILSGLIGADGTVVRRDLRPTPKDGDELVEAVYGAITTLCDRQDPASIPVGIGFPALVTRDGTTRYGPNIALAEYPLGQQMSARLANHHVLVENDASAAAWGEFAVGAGRDVREAMALFTLGTGVGGGLIIGGDLLRGAHGFAGELGHIIVEIDGEPGPSGVRGELEAYASGTAMQRMATEAHAAGRFDGTALEGPEPPTSEAVTTAAADGLAPAVEILTTVGRYLGVGIATVVNAFDPEVVAVGGGAAAGGELILGPARRALAEHVMGHGHRPEVPVVAAELGPDAGMVGAALLALRAGP